MVSNSVLWLLEPMKSRTDELEPFDATEQNGMTKRNIMDMASSWGVHPKRIIFVERVGKKEHVARLVELRNYFRIPKLFEILFYSCLRALDIAKLISFWTLIYMVLTPQQQMQWEE